ncbi:MAG: ABC transporter ATP-binding protein, partial [Pseudomonas sp.]
HYLMDHGQIVEEISAAELSSKQELLHRCLGV